MNRYRDVLKLGRRRHKDAKHLTWCTRENFSNMYDCVYDRKVAAGAAIKHDHKLMFDKDGNQTLDETQMFGRKTRYELTRPEQVLFVDETGCNTNQKDDGHIGGRLYVLPRDKTEGGLLGITSDNHFTVMCFTSGTGKPVMCSIILKSNKDIKDVPIQWKWGFDVMRDPKTGETKFDLFRNNCGENKAMSGGPKCFFNGQTIPCFVCCTPNASISSELLAGMLKTIDSYGVFNRSNGAMPFLLLDGHFSRLQLPFFR
jgi:hypothetical protein